MKGITLTKSVIKRETKCYQWGVFSANARIDVCLLKQTERTGRMDTKTLSRQSLQYVHIVKEMWEDNTKDGIKIDTGTGDRHLILE